MSAVQRVLRAVHRLVTDWFAAPEPNAAGRMGLFRILFGLFYLWHLSLVDASILSGLPDGYRRTPILLVDLLSLGTSQPLLQGLDSVLAGALVLLAFGYRTRAVTAVVLVLGVLREALFSEVDVENANVFLVFYIPLFMLVAGRWGEAYSLDRLRSGRRGEAVVEPSDDSWPHFLGARAVLVVLALLFCSSPVFKTLLGGTWLAEPELLSNFMLRQSIQSVELGLTPNPLAPWIVAHPPLGYGLQLGVLLFEGLFFLSLCGRDLRGFFVALAMVFHSINALFLIVSFTPMLIVYGLFVDWETLLRRLPFRMKRLADVMSRFGLGIAVATAALLALQWHSGASLMFNLGGWLDWQTMWLPVLPLAILWAVRSAMRIVSGHREPLRA